MRYDVGPLYAKMFYTSNGHSHVMTVCLKLASVSTPPTVGVCPNVVTKGVTTLSADVALNEYADALKSMLSTSSAIDSYDIYYKPEPLSEPIWIYGAPIATATGTATDASKANEQFTISFRSAAGHHMRIQLMEAIFGYDTVYAPAAIAIEAHAAPAVTYLLGSTGAVVARDGTFPSAVIRGIGKYNDLLRRRFLLS